MSETLFIDFESRSTIDLKVCGSDVYCRDLSTRVMACGYAFDNEPVQLIRMGEPPTPRIMFHVASGGKVVAHNIAFDYLMWQHSWRREFPKLPELKTEQLECTMARCYAMALPGKLANAAAALGLNAQKDMKGQRIMLQLSQPRSLNPLTWYEPNDDTSSNKVESPKKKFERMYAYCLQDIEVEREIYRRTLPLSDSEREMWILDHKINQRGVAVDVPSAKIAVELVKSEEKRLNDEIFKITKGYVSSTNAHASIAGYLRYRGVESTGVGKSDVADLLEKEDLPSDVRRALLIRQEAAKSSTAKFTSILNRACEDGRMRSTTQYHGAGTGRWAGRGFQIQNLPRPRLKQESIDDIFRILGK